MRALFVHGMGRSPLSGVPLTWALGRAGIACESFGYAVTVDDFADIRERLRLRIRALAARSDYVLIGHSLGGVLLRAALRELPAVTPRPKRLFLLGSPVHASRLAQALRRRRWFPVIARTSGELLASATAMEAIGAPGVPCTNVIGVRGLRITRRWFGAERNDGVVAHSEAIADWMDDVVTLPVVHTLLPTSPRVAQIIVQRIARDAAQEVA